MRVRWLAAAAREVREAMAYYEAQRPGLGSELIADIRHARTLLEKHSDVGRMCDSWHRRFKLRRFPFAVIYRIGVSAIEVVALAHTSRRPGYWSVREAAADYAVARVA